jgi:putative ABC transport system substrate-binding protein
MQRRSFLTLFGASAAAWPLAARAQQQLAVPVIGFMSTRSQEDSAHLLDTFHRGLAESGYVEGRNVSIEFRWARGQYDLLPAMAADLVRRRVSVLVAVGGAVSPLAAKRATSTIPIVFGVGDDPVQLGLVASLSRPGGNLTGVTTLNVEIGPKRLELMHELVPSATKVALLVNPTNATGAILSQDIEAAARALGLQLVVLHASDEIELGAAFARLRQFGVGGLVIGTDAFFNSRSEQIAALAVRHAMPTIYQYREFAVAGGLMSYGGGSPVSYHLMGSYAGRILKGEKPADLPVQQYARIELIINMKTAKALGITFPTAILVRADEVIE